MGQKGVHLCSVNQHRTLQPALARCRPLAGFCHMFRAGWVWNQSLHAQSYGKRPPGRRTARAALEGMFSAHALSRKCPELGPELKAQHYVCPCRCCLTAQTSMSWTSSMCGIR